MLLHIHTHTHVHVCVVICLKNHIWKHVCFQIKITYSYYILFLIQKLTNNRLYMEYKENLTRFKMINNFPE